MAAAAEDAGARTGSWLYGPVTDLLLGGGVAYLLSIPVLFVVSRVWTEATGWPLGLIVLFAMFVNGPHYGATLLRVYEQREERRKYAFFAVWVTAFIILCFVVAVRDAFVGSVLFTLYISWAPWHFAGQNYGISLMFLRRRGVPIPDRAKRFLYASFVLSFALAFVAVHAVNSNISYNAGGATVSNHYGLLRLGIPRGLVTGLLSVLGLLYVTSLGAAFVGLRKGASWRELAPGFCPVVLQAVWYAMPAFLLQSTSSNPTGGLAFAAIWIATAHSLQYLWVTTYYARHTEPPTEVAPYLARATLAGATVGILPGLLFAPGLLGTVPWDAGLAILVFSVVNLHHFILDGAIWKLRDGRVARALLRPSEKAAASEPITPPRPFVRPLFWAVGIVCLAVPFIDYFERTIAIDQAGKDMARAQKISERLHWIGRGSPDLRNQIARNLAGQGNRRAALEEYRRSLEMFPTSAAWIGIAKVHVRSGELRPAREAYDSALALDPDAVDALVGLAILDLQQADAASPGGADLDDAITKLERVRTLDPENVNAARILAHAYVTSGNSERARALIIAMLPHANASERPKLEADLAALQGSP